MNNIIKNFSGNVGILASRTGVGKTRIMINDACFYGVGKHYDWSKKKWIKDNNSSEVVFITNELSAKDFVVMVICNLSGVAEEKFYAKNYSAEEEIILGEALSLLDSSPLHVISSMYKTSDLIIDNKYTREARYVFIDTHNWFKYKEEINQINRKTDCIFIISMQVGYGYNKNKDRTPNISYIERSKSGNIVKKWNMGVPSTLYFDHGICRMIDDDEKL